MSQYEILVLIIYAQKPSAKAHANVSSIARDLSFGLSLHQHPYFVYNSSKGSGEHAHLCRLTRGLAAPHCDKYQNLI